ncbi:MAG: methyltransferase domain-containing protein [Solirubrobacterales bacterium]|nr:methyltransferase domain-containing protein [Solirubrobacterales bacterium]MCB8969422.1 methyltransferase domain-containing protein [Thermoleophilales bacterium]MCO5327320.1 class I SAM-dependent methyltransferase [Solirubrobacterales bacterium]
MPEPATKRYLQDDQPEGVPPLELTGERTLPDVPEENYWYRRHLAVYEWIAPQVAGMQVADLACGEGYGSDVLAQRAAGVIGVDANPDAHEHARLRYVRDNLRFQRDLVENVADLDVDLDAVVFLQTIEHIEDVPSLLGAITAAAPLAFISTPNRLTLAPEGAEKSDNPWHLREYLLQEYRAVLEGSFASVEILGLFHARKLAVHERAIALGWDHVHRALRITKPFYDRFTPAISAADFALRDEGEADLEKALDFVAVCRR